MFKIISEKREREREEEGKKETSRLSISFLNRTHVLIFDNIGFKFSSFVRMKILFLV